MDLTFGLGSIVNAVGSGIQQRQQRKWDLQDYERNKADHLEFWNMQNEYNSPTSQMARLQEAGLNPNLIYGKGSQAANSAAEQPRPQKRQSKATNVLSEMLQFNDIGLRTAQVDNLKAHNNVLSEEAVLKRNQAATELRNAMLKDKQGILLGKQGLKIASDINLNTKRGKQIEAQTNWQKWNTQFQQSMEHDNQEIAKASMRKMRADADLAEIQANVQDMTKAQQIARIKSEADYWKYHASGTRYNAMMSKLEKEWMDNGMTKNDPYYYRIFPKASNNFKSWYDQEGTYRTNKGKYNTDKNGRYLPQGWTVDKHGNALKPR